MFKKKRCKVKFRKEKPTVKLVINGMEILAYQDETIFQAAERNCINIPHFCYHPRLKVVGACRMCVVEVEGRRNLEASCSTPVKEGQVVYTHSERVIEARRTILELLLANHDLNCPTCKKNLNCKLQEYSTDLMIDEISYVGEMRHNPKDHSSVSIQRDPDKCILCGRCVRVCGDVQTVHAIGQVNRGFYMNVEPPFKHELSESSCINCGQCVVNCPVGALTEHSSIHEFIKELVDKSKTKKHFVVQVAPSIRATLGELFGMPAGTPVTGKLVTALREVGFDMVFDTDLAADITIVEEATEFVKRLKNNDNLPMITTCCPAWIKFGEQFFIDELEHMSSCRSPQAILASLVRTYYAEKKGVDADDIVLVDIMPCTAKKYEIQRPEFAGDVDYVLTTVELAKLIKQFNIDFEDLPDSEFDNPLGISSGAGAIFGRSGGVMEAALRTAADFLTGKDLKKVEYEKVRGLETLKEAEINIAGHKIKVAAVQTLGEARKIMDDIRAGKSPYHFIEIMACYGGCIGGGGQPPLKDDDVLVERAGALNKQDVKMKYRKSHKNPAVLEIYKEYVGEFGGEKAHKLLHTKYSKKDYI
ncbi:4Fe-4S binding protein [Candidatus Woesearchaeota archaeon]|jgi:NADP-reducing hydrogenase subunit HndD|nr:4Fe-4S binding protein [Candidatus Woesearchaeota archaeon]MBT3537920.1 4Fe-4S binding protein [Candidatus Woesearchaeota archaeon]MBT4716529.1 4Fe-4S binding protein [Candidatus Woesearchaeota archaeon]MBT7105589.1 4Fe-4S binding protein [Candidatus Woesearchaeota archaeon]MBT7931410.1 4Fe-4S binding protein [Candidatus Woesearchaeota archaeon]